MMRAPHPLAFTGMGGRWLLLAAALSIVTLWLNSKSAAFLGAYFNSDALYMANLFHSAESGTLGMMHYSHLPNVFPEAMLILPVMAAGVPAEYAYYAYSTVLVFVFIVSTAALYRAVDRERYSSKIYIFILFIEALLLVEAGRQLSFLIIGVHGSCFVISVTAAVLAWRTLTEPGGWLLPAALGTLVFLSSFSDILFNFAFVAPFVAASAVLMLLGNVRPLRTIVLCLVVIVAATLGTLSLQLLPHSALPPSSPDELLENVFRFTREVAPDFAVACFVPLVAALICLAIYVYFRRKSVGPNAEDATGLLTTENVFGSGPALLFFWILGLCASFATLSVTIIAFVDGGSYRYALPAVWWPLILLPTIFVQRSTRLLQTLALAGTAGLVGLSLVAAGRPAPSFWPKELAHCIEEARREMPLRDGLAEYWVARPVTEMSRGRVVLSQVVGNADPYIWINNPLDYFVGRTWDTVRDYNFFVLNDLEPEKIFARFGQPSRRLRCGTYQIAQYDDASRIKEELKAWLERDRERRLKEGAVVLPDGQLGALVLR